MDFAELVKARYSLRSFSPKKVEKEKLELILEAGRLAPTAHNNQPQRILVVESEEGIKKLQPSTGFVLGAPVVLVVCVDTTLSWKRTKYDGKDHGEIDASIVATHMMLQAADLGLGTTWIGSFDPRVVRQAFSIPELIEPLCLLPLGYPSETAQISPFHYNRKKLTETVSYEKF